MQGTLYTYADDTDAPERAYVMGDEVRVQIETPAAEGYYDEEAEREPLAWCNSAAMDWNAAEDSVTVSISVGDPRGAFAFTVRRLADGSLIMHTPYPGEGMPHMPLRELHPGTYEIGD